MRYDNFNAIADDKLRRDAQESYALMLKLFPADFPELIHRLKLRHSIVHETLTFSNRDVVICK